MRKIEFVIGVGDDFRGKLWKEKLIVDDRLQICYPINSREEFLIFCEFDIEFVATSYLAIVLEIYYPKREAVAHISSENKWMIGFPIYLTSESSEFPYKRVWEMMFNKAIEVAERLPEKIVRIGFEVYRLKANQSEEEENEMLNAFNQTFLKLCVGRKEITSQ